MRDKILDFTNVKYFFSSLVYKMGSKTLFNGRITTATISYRKELISISKSDVISMGTQQKIWAVIIIVTLNDKNCNLSFASMLVLF